MTPKKDWKPVFLAELAASGNVRASCEVAQISRKTAYQTRTKHAAFAQAWDDALDEAADLLEQEARRRAYEGWEEPVFGSLGKGSGSGEIGAVRKYSDTLLIFLLKGARPEKYRERSDVKHSGHIDVSRLSDDELRAIVEG